MSFSDCICVDRICKCFFASVVEVLAVSVDDVAVEVVLVSDVTDVANIEIQLVEDITAEGEDVVELWLFDEVDTLEGRKVGRRGRGIKLLWSTGNQLAGLPAINQPGQPVDRPAGRCGKVQDWTISL